MTENKDAMNIGYSSPWVSNERDVVASLKIALCSAEFIYETFITSYLHFLPFLTTEVVQVIESIPCRRQMPIDTAYSKPLLQMT